MAYRSYQQLPYSKGASLANVLSGLFGDLRKKQQEKNYYLQMEEQRLAKNREESERLKAQPLEVFGPMTKPKLSEKEQLELEKMRADISKTKSETAKNVWDRASADKLARAYDDIDFLKKQNQLEGMLYKIEKQSLQQKFEGKGVPQDGNEYDELIKMFEGLEDRLLKIAVTTKELEDKDGYENAQTQLVEVRKRLKYLRENHPVESLFPKEETPVEEEKPSWLGRRWQDVKDVGREIYQGKMSGPTPATPKPMAELPQEPPKPKELSKFWMYYGDTAWWNGKDEALDYLGWYVLAHPEDKKAMRKFRELQEAGLF